MVNGKISKDFEGRGLVTEQMSDQIAQMWNVGHIVQCLRAVVKVHWSEGLTALFAMRRVK